MSAVQNPGRRGGNAAARPVNGHTPMRSYDFRRPDKFSKDQLRTLHMLHENYARVVSTVLSGQLRTTVEVAVASVKQETYAEFSLRLHNPGAIAVVSLAPLSGNAVLEVEPGVAMYLVDRVLGGAGTSAVQLRELTEIELTVARRLVWSLLEHLRDGWRNIVEVTPAVESVETNPMFTQVVAPGEMCAVVSFTIRVGLVAGTICLCLPYLLMEPVVSKLTAFVWFSGAPRARAAADGEMIKARLQEVSVEVVAELGGAVLTLEDLLGLSVGDVVVLDRATVDPILIRVGHSVKLSARPGTHRGRLALSIIERVEEGQQ
ncbi:MAG: flagellar motor switch protein FliM [Bacillota bacterium]|nr:flagellar motor switch protein FliM [Bacillota bacterium]